MRRLPRAERALSALEAAHAGFPEREGGLAARRARARLARVLWTKRGERKLPGQSELDAALSAATADDIAWMCEFSPLGPLYFLPTRAFVHLLAAKLRALGVRRVLEVAAGDGLLARALAAAAPKLRVFASDSGAWEKPEGRMSRSEQRALADQPVSGLCLGANVARMTASAAIAHFKPDLVFACWLPPGHLLDDLVRANVRYVLEIGAGHGITGSAFSWRFAHEFWEGEIERRARCRLDYRPRTLLHSRLTLYPGAAHAEFFEEPVARGDWLWQFRPRAAPRSPRRRASRSPA